MASIHIFRESLHYHTSTKSAVKKKCANRIGKRQKYWGNKWRYTMPSVQRDHYNLKFDIFGNSIRRQDTLRHECSPTYGLKSDNEYLWTYIGGIWANRYAIVGAIGLCVNYYPCLYVCMCSYVSIRSVYTAMNVRRMMYAHNYVARQIESFQFRCMVRKCVWYEYDIGYKRANEACSSYQ